MSIKVIEIVYKKSIAILHIISNVVYCNSDKMSSISGDHKKLPITKGAYERYQM